MANFLSGMEEQCPYDPGHKLQPGSRMQRHLIKCRANHLKDTTSPFHIRATEMKICQFSSAHHVHRDFYNEHLRTCPDRMLVADLRSQDHNEDEPSWKKLVPRINSVKAPDGDEENWDDDATTTTYDPMKKVRSAKGSILHNVQGKTKSERRGFRQETRLAATMGDDDYNDDEEEDKMEVIARKGTVAKSTGSSCPSAPPAQSNSTTSNQPLGRPRGPLRRPHNRGRGRGFSNLSADLASALDDGDEASITWIPPGFGRGRGSTSPKQL